MSSDSGGADGVPVVRRDLVDYLRKSCSDSGSGRPPRVGIEQELLPADPATGRAVPFHHGVEKAFLGLLDSPAYSALPGEAHPTTLFRGHATVNLEPGGQMEFSGSPFRSLLEVERELADACGDFARSAGSSGLALLSLGAQPITAAAEIELVPKRRYRIMDEYFAAHGGARYRDMMTRTASLQASFDFADEATAGRMMRAAMLAAPVVSALFANSPLEGGREAGRLGTRAAVWRETDNSRCGLIPEAVDGEWSFDRYVDFALGVPAILVRAGDGGVAPAGGFPFRDLLKNGVDGRRVTMADWELHLSTIFTVARLKGVLEVRCCDAPPPGAAMAVPALWTGLLYHGPSLDATLELLAPLRPLWSELVEAASVSGLRGHVPGSPTLLELARELVAAARRGLEARGLKEEAYLEPAEVWIANGRSPAEEALAVFRRAGIEGLVRWAKLGPPD